LCAKFIYSVFRKDTSIASSLMWIILH